MKQNGNEIQIFKIHSTRLRKSNWNLNLSIQSALKNGEIIRLAESDILRKIDKINNLQDVVKNIKEIRKKIKKIKKEEISKENQQKIKQLYLDLYKIQFKPDYVCIIMDKNSDYYRANKGFKINGIKYKQLFGTTGGIKNSTIIYVNEKIHKTLMNKINNGRDLNKPIVPAKLQAYMALSCSASIPVSTPNGILVVNDAITHFKEKIIKLDDSNSIEPKMEIIDDCDIELIDSDGYGLILPEQMQKWMEEIGENYLASGVCIRNSFCKGMLFTFDFLDFAENVAHNYIVKDAWGYEHDIRNIKIILTTSMLKLWDSYNSIEHYLECCQANDYTFSITKVTPKKLENERNMNYQFLQTLRLNDEKINKLIEPTINEIKDVLGGDYRKTLLFLKGTKIEENEDVFTNDLDFIKALMINKNVINDPFIKNKVHYFIKKKINDAKTGVIKVRGNFSIISGDPYLLCQSIFGMELTGLLKKGQFYNKYWNDLNIKRVAAFRAPMTCHNNIRILNLVDNDEVNYWYRYMNTVTIFNAWDSTAHALNGADKDSDTILTTNNEIILDSIEELPTIMCIQRTAKKKIPTIDDFVESNIKAFGDKIGSTTNHITSMKEIQSHFNENSLEYQTLEYRIMCGQLFQQNAIDKTKGIECRDMPKEWYDYTINKINENDDEETKRKKQFNLSILANKKPYFMIYIYPEEHKRYRDYIDNANKKCVKNFRLTLDELIKKPKKSKKEKVFLEYYYQKMPVGIGDCYINKIAWKFEKEFDNFINNLKIDLKFDYSIYKSDKQYSDEIFKKIKKIYNNYNNLLQQYLTIAKSNRLDEDEIKLKRKSLKEYFKTKAFEICPNEKELCNIVLDLCYIKDKNKQFAWDICGDIIVKNLLEKNNYTYSYPIRCDGGDIEYCFNKYKMISKKIARSEND